MSYILPYPEARPCWSASACRMASMVVWSNVESERSGMAALSFDWIELSTPSIPHFPSYMLPYMMRSGKEGNM
jgi:hypothetical protein